jgi:hypothetical protein
VQRSFLTSQRTKVILLSQQTTKYIVIELNERNASSRTFLKDFTTELSDYKVERLLPEGRTPELNKPHRAWLGEVMTDQLRTSSMVIKSSAEA